MSMMQSAYDLGTLTQVAAAHNIPPAILASLARQGPGLSGGSVMGMTRQRASSIPIAAAGADQARNELEASATALEHDFVQTQDWNKALSLYLTGDQNASASPTDPAGGQVWSILGMAASDPTLGMQGFVPTDGFAFMRSAQSFSGLLGNIQSAGGVVTKQHVDAWNVASQSAAVAGGFYLGPGRINTQFGGAPFDPRDAGVNQPFGPTSLGMEPAYGGYAHFHMGVDYAVPDRSPLNAMFGGTVTQVYPGTWGPGGNAVVIRAQDGTTLLYGHLSGFNVKVGDQVQPGQQIGLSGGAGEPGSGMSTGAHLHLEMRDAHGLLVNADPYVQQAVHDAKAGVHPAATALHPDLFAQRVLQAANLPVTPTNVAVIRTMAQGEGTSAGFNPLATTQPMPGSRAFNSVGVQSYPDEQTGILATAKTLRNGNFDAIVTGMASGQPIAYFAAGPAADNLRRWQGGSNQDVSLMANAQPLPLASDPGQPTPKDVNDFADKLQSAGVSPSEFAHTYPHFSANQRRLMQLNGDLEDYLQAVRTLRGPDGQGVVDPATINGYVRAQPHPIYNDVTSGDLMDTYNKAVLHSVPLLNRTPYLSEAAKLASSKANWNETGQFYANMAQPAQSPTLRSEQQAPGPQPQRPAAAAAPSQQPTAARMGGPQ